MYNKKEIVFVFDTTGSMYPVLQSVREKLEETIGTLFKEIPDLRIGLGANGDYGDAKYNYTTKYADLTTDLYNLTQFVRNTERTLGFGNGGEAYEVVLREAQSVFDWSLNSDKVLVMIGDEIAHTSHWHENKKHLNWSEEAIKLYHMGVQIYTIQCLSRGKQEDSYYEQLARFGNGLHLKLDQFNDINPLLMGIAYRQVSVERAKEYETTFLNTRTVNRTLDASFGKLTNRDPKTGRFVSTTNYSTNTNINKFDIVPAGRFQVMTVPHDIAIKEFVESNLIPFKKGKGFYKFTKAEEVQENKEVVLRDRDTGDMYSGSKAREMIGLPFGTRGKINPYSISIGNYDVFIQSTSVNRKLKAFTEFLYEVDMSL